MSQICGEARDFLPPVANLGLPYRTPSGNQPVPGKEKVLLPATCLTASQTSPASSPPTGRAVVCNIGRVGDTILCNSILEPVLSSYATVDYLCGKYNAALVQSDSALNKVTAIHNSLSGYVGLAKVLIGRRYDAFIGLKDCYSLTNLLLGLFCRSRIKTGWNSDRFRPFNRDVRSIWAPGLHKVEMMRRVGSLAGLRPSEYKPRLVLASDSLQWFRQNHTWNKPFIFLNLSATDPNRMWPVEKWEEYTQATGLNQRLILVNGLPRDQAKVAQLCQKLPRAIPFPPRNFMDVAAAISDARLVLTGDTGVVHACSALNKPVVALYSTGNSAEVNRPLTSHYVIIKAQPGCMVPTIDPLEASAKTRASGLLDLLELTETQPVMGAATQAEPKQALTYAPRA